MRKEKGFTLIELVIVIAILAILAGVAIPRYLSITKDAAIAAEKADVGAIRAGILNKAIHDSAKAKSDKMNYPTTLEDTNVGPIFGAILEPASSKDMSERGWTGTNPYTPPAGGTGGTYRYVPDTGEFLYTAP